MPFACYFAFSPADSAVDSSTKLKSSSVSTSLANHTQHYWSKQLSTASSLILSIIVSDLGFKFNVWH